MTRRREIVPGPLTAARTACLTLWRFPDRIPRATLSTRAEMSESTDDEAYDYDETGRESDDYSDDFGDETDDDAVDASPARTNSAEPEDAPAFTGASMATGADVSQAASSAAAATARFQAAATAAAASGPTPAAAEAASGASDPESATRALQALNLMATGVVSHTDALLRGFDSAEAFASRVRAIASASLAVAGRDASDASDAIGADDLNGVVAAAIEAAAAGDSATHTYEGYKLQNLLGEVMNRANKVGWTSHAHTGVDVPVFAFGVGAEAFRGSRDNFRVGQLMIDALGVDPAEGYKAFRDRLSLVDADETPP